MDAFQGTVLFLLALLLTVLVWNLHCRAARSRVGGRETELTVLLTCGDCPSELEQSVRGLLWLMDNDFLPRNTSVVIRDGGMGPETAGIAGILARENPPVSIEDRRNGTWTRNT